jgi:hypothetical protein
MYQLPGAQHHAPGLSLTSIAVQPPLFKQQAETFHRVVARLIYVGTRASPDILLALAFLCGRVSCPTLQDKIKLQQLLGYLHTTIDMKLCLGADSLDAYMTCVDAAFAVHSEMQSHTGSVISLSVAAASSAS